LKLIHFNRIIATNTTTVNSNWMSVIPEWCLNTGMNVEHTILHVWYGQYWRERKQYSLFKICSTHLKFIHSPQEIFLPSYHFWKYMRMNWHTTDVQQVGDDSSRELTSVPGYGKSWSMDVSPADHTYTAVKVLPTSALARTSRKTYNKKIIYHNYIM
jgi:hypothetical protein